MTLVDVNPTILEDYKTFMHEDHQEKILHDIILLNLIMILYYEREKYGCINFYVTKLPLVMLRLLLFLSSSLHMVVFACLDNLFAYKIPMHRKRVRLKVSCHMLYDALFVFQFLSFM